MTLSKTRRASAVLFYNLSILFFQYIYNHTKPIFSNKHQVHTHTDYRYALYKSRCAYTPGTL